MQLVSYVVGQRFPNYVPGETLVAREKIEKPEAIK
jgi:hypothetical protein